MTFPFPTYPQQLYYMAQRIRDAIVAGFADQGVTLPTRKLIYAGSNVPVDPDAEDDPHPGLLAIALVDITQGKPGTQWATEQIPPLSERMATFQIELHRPVDATITGQQDLPEDDSITYDAETFFTDASVLYGSLEWARANNSIVQAHVPFAIRFVRPGPVEGGSGVTVAQIVVSLV
jgi:hypothetical protein